MTERNPRIGCKKLYPSQLLFELFEEAEGIRTASLAGSDCAAGWWVIHDIPAGRMQFMRETRRLYKLLVTQVRKLALEIRDGFLGCATVDDNQWPRFYLCDV